jgi:hypothetical protein
MIWLPQSPLDKASRPRDRRLTHVEASRIDSVTLTTMRQPIAAGAHVRGREKLARLKVVTF